MLLKWNLAEKWIFRAKIWLLLMHEKTDQINEIKGTRCFLLKCHFNRTKPEEGKGGKVIATLMSKCISFNVWAWCVPCKMPGWKKAFTATRSDWKKLSGRSRGQAPRHKWKLVRRKPSPKDVGLAFRRHQIQNKSLVQRLNGFNGVVLLNLVASFFPFDA